MAQTIRITVTPDLEKALQVLRQSTLGTLNTTELIKMAVGGFARMKISTSQEIKDMDRLAAYSFYQWAKEDGTLEVNNIAHPEKLKPFVPEPYVSNR